MSVIKMYVDVAAATYEAAQIDLPADGTLYALHLMVSVSDATPASSEQVFAELSFISTPQYAANDSRGSLAQCNIKTYFADAARLAISGNSEFSMTGLNVRLNAGERIYLHCTPEGSIAANAIAYLYIEDGMDQPRALRRR